MIQEDKIVEFLVEMPKCVGGEDLMEVNVPVTSKEWDEVVVSQCRYRNTEHRCGIIFEEDSPTLYAKIISGVIAEADRVEGEGYLSEDDGWFEINCPWDFHDDSRLIEADKESEEFRIANREECRRQFHESYRILQERIDAGRWHSARLNPESISTYGGWKSDFNIGISTAKGNIEYGKHFPNTDDPTPVCKVRYTWNEQKNSLMDEIIASYPSCERSLRKIEYGTVFSQTLYEIRDPNNVSLELISKFLDSIGC